MAGVVEELGKAGNTFITAMATQPLALALVACNVIAALEGGVDIKPSSQQ